jgi:hypothetical protein
VTRRTLDPAEQGSIGLVADADTVLLLPFTEPLGVAASDRQGNLEDLVPLVDAPTRDAITTWADALSWRFDDQPLLGGDQAGRSTLLTRDLSVQAILAFGVQNSVGSVLIGRGLDLQLGGGAGERTSFELVVDNDDAPQLWIFLRWQRLDGTTFQDVGVVMPSIARSSWYLLTATRRRVSATEVVCSYYLGGELLGQTTSNAGLIAGATTATTRIGAAFYGWIDELAVIGRELSPEEVRATWERLTVHQPAGLAMFRGHAPPGAPWFHAGTGPAGMARIAGQGLGAAMAAVHGFQATYHPHRAIKADLPAWEALVGLQAREDAPLTTRRARVVDQLSRDNGYAVAQVQATVAPAFDLTPPEVEILSFAPTFSDDFNSLDEQRWTSTGAAWDTSVDKQARLQVAAAADIRWDGLRRLHRTLELGVEADRSAYFAARMTLTALPAGGEAGLALRHGAAGHRLWFGVRRTGAVYELVYQRWQAGAWEDANPVVLAVTANTPHWLRLRVADLPLPDSKVSLEWSTDNVTFDAELAEWPPGHTWAGFYGRAWDAALSGNLDVRWDQLLVRQPFGTRALCWYAYRDLGLGGTPDMPAANALVRQLKPAHTHGAAITSKSLLCNTEGHGCGLGPLGALPA